MVAKIQKGKFLLVFLHHSVNKTMCRWFTLEAVTSHLMAYTHVTIHIRYTQITCGALLNTLIKSHIKERNRTVTKAA